MSVFVQIYRDAENGEMVLRNVDEDGDLITSMPKISLKLQDLAYAEELIAKLRRVHYTDAVSGDKKRCYALATKPESDASSDGHDSATEDLRIGGGTGGGGPTRYRVITVAGDYLVCHNWDGTTEGGTAVNIAKPVELRHSLTVQTIDGVDVTYGSYAINYGKCQRTVSATGYTSQVEVVVPTFMEYTSGMEAAQKVLTEIWADTPVGGTGVTVSSVPLTLMDTNRAARAWCEIA